MDGKAKIPGTRVGLNLLAIFLILSSLAVITLAYPVGIRVIGGVNDFNTTVVKCTNSSCSALINSTRVDMNSSPDNINEYTINGSGTQYHAEYDYQFCRRSYAFKIETKGSTGPGPWEHQAPLEEKGFCNSTVNSITHQPDPVIQFAPALIVVNASSAFEWSPGGPTTYPADLFQFFASTVNVTVTVTNSTGDVVFNQTNTTDIDINRTANVTFTWVPLQNDTHTIAATTDVVDCQCNQSNKASKNQTKGGVDVKDTTPPTNLVFIPPTPANNTYLPASSFQINITTNDTIDIALLEFNGINESMEKFNSSSAGRLKSSLSDGNYTFRVFANDTNMNGNYSEFRTVAIDTTNPTIEIILPQNITYPSAVRELNVTVNDTNLASCFYSLNGGTNTTFSCTANTTIVGAEGQNEVIVYVDDYAGNLNSSARGFTVDTTAPTTVFIPPTPANLTFLNQGSFNINVTSNEAIDTFVLEFNGVNESMEQFNATSAGILKSALADGSYTFRVFVNDSVDNSNYTESRSVMIDATSPTIEIILPENITYNSSTRDLNITVNDTNLDSCFYSLNSGPNVSFFCTTNTTLVGAEGQNEVVVYVNDSAGNLNSSLRGFTIDTTLPNIVFIPPTPANNSFLNQSNFDINVTSDEAMDSFVLEFNGINETIDQFNSTSAGKTKAGLPDGVYSFRVFGNDSIDNGNYTETRTVAIDTTPPTVDIIDPQNITYTALPVPVNVSFNDTNLDSCFYSLDGGANITLPSCGNTTVSPSDGQHEIEVWANDSAGNYNFSKVGFTSDSTPPSLVFITPTPPNNTLQNTNSVQVNITSNEALSFTLLEFNGTNQTMELFNATAAGLNLSGLGEGSQTILAWANDSSGNMNSTEFRVFTVDTIQPLIDIIFPENITYNSATRELNVTASDANLDSCFYSLNAGANTTFSCTDNTTIVGSEGQNEVIAYANDSAGNLNSSTRGFTIDTTPPTPVFIDPTPQNSSSLNRDYIDVNITANESLDSAVLEVNGVNESIDVFNSTSAGTNKTGLADGIYTVRVFVNDSAGNGNYTESRTFTVDTTPPSVEVLSITPDPAEYTIDSVTINWSASDANLNSSLMNVTYPNGTLLGTFISNTTLTPAELVAKGLYNVTVYANDTAGNDNITFSDFLVRDSIPPNTFDLQTQNITVGDNETIKVNATDISGVDTIQAEINGTNYTMSLESGSALNGTWNATIQNLPVGVHPVRIYANDTDGNLNGTLTGIFEVFRNASNISLFLNSTEANITVVGGQSVNITAILNMPSAGNITIFENDAFETNGSSPLEFIKPYNSGGLYRITASFDGDENFSASNKTFNITVNVPLGPPGAPASGGGGGGGGSLAPIINETSRPCVDSWVCGDWSSCSDGKRTRTCTYSGNCPAENISISNKPTEEDSCGEEPLGGGGVQQNETESEQPPEGPSITGLIIANAPWLAGLLVLVGIAGYYFYRRRRKKKEKAPKTKK